MPSTSILLQIISVDGVSLIHSSHSPPSSIPSAPPPAASNGKTLESVLDALYFIASEVTKTNTKTKMKNEWRFAA